ncbi:MAG TPA: amidohydrolase family protein [Thermoplasmata archaeon]|nr:amidohydrolase family protein [Thermoplasmata archaeon]
MHLHLSQYWPDLSRNSYSSHVDFTVRGLLAELDAQGIGHGVLLQLNESPSVAETLREGEAMRDASGGRLLRTSTVDPTQGIDAVRDAVRRWEDVPELVALKLYPGYQHFYPHDPRLAPLYEFAARRRLVVMFHQGDTLSADGLVKFARPIEVDEVAVRYREIPMVLCHLGNPWIEEAAELVYKNANVYTDTSGVLWDPRLPHFPRLVARARDRLGQAIAEIGSTSRILYGSDWPLESIDLAVSLVTGLDLPEPDREAILGGNARRLFRLGQSE